MSVFSEAEDGALSSWRSQLISSSIQACSKVSWWYFVQSSINARVDLRHLHLRWSWFNCKARAQHWTFQAGQAHTTALQPSCSETLGSYAQLIWNFEKKMFSNADFHKCVTGSLSQKWQNFYYYGTVPAFVSINELVQLTESVLRPEPLSREVILHNSFCLVIRFVKVSFLWGKHTLAVYLWPGECSRDKPW